MFEEFPSYQPNSSKLVRARPGGCMRLYGHIYGHCASGHMGNHMFQHKETGLVAQDGERERFWQQRKGLLFWALKRVLKGLLAGLPIIVPRIPSQCDAGIRH